MKRNPFYLFVIAAFCFIAVVIFWWKPGTVPVSDTIFIDPLDDGSEIDLREWAITTEDQIEFLDVTPFKIQVEIDTKNVLTIYDPKITVVWDTSGAKYD